ncbi:hypothetical protein JTE90_003904 [Oedothorax gibbosus]|uniref:USP domain-containing protein n=1 Tax=Oedothorax gibbosus TaxID=931172 RepID=A0AAV6UH70_9ARAC|nr:hypothetical protein JTE90_003904 [Oedothorax gibbosus]
METHNLNRDFKKSKFSKIARFRQWIKNLFTCRKKTSSVSTEVIKKDDELKENKDVKVPQTQKDNLSQSEAARLPAAAEIVVLVECLLAAGTEEKLEDNVPQSEKEGKKDLQVHPQEQLSLDEILRNEAQGKKQKPKQQQSQVKHPSSAKAADDVVATVTSSSMPPGYANKDYVSCYANSVCQCMFSFDQFMTCIAQDPAVGKALQKLCQKHAQSKGLMDTRELRKEVGRPFSAKEQQDAEEFFSALINQNESLKALTTNVVLNTRRCRNRSCGHEITTGDLVNCIRLGTDRSSIHIKELIEEYSKWECLGDEVCCGLCNNLCAQNFEIEVPAQILVCQLMLWNEKGHKKSIKVKGLSDTVLKLKDNNYQLQAAVFHESSSAHCGHYTALRRYTKNQWIKMDDTKVSVKNKWPQSKTPYLLFYKRV